MFDSESSANDARRRLLLWLVSLPAAWAGLSTAACGSSATTARATGDIVAATDPLAAADTLAATDALGALDTSAPNDVNASSDDEGDEGHFEVVLRPRLG